MGTLTDNGFEIKTENEYFEEETELYQEIDHDFNLDPSTPDGLKIAHDSEVFAALDQAVKDAYDSRDPVKATGSDLDVLRSLTGTTRNQGTPTRVYLKLTGVAYTLIPEGSQVKDTSGNTFATEAEITLGNDGIGYVYASCTENGSIEVGSNTITNIETVISGWQSVTNPSAGVTGTDVETDGAFRSRSAKAVGRASIGIKDSLYGEIFAVKNVSKVQIYENRTNDPSHDPLLNPQTLPAHSIAIVVDGGDDDEVARAIFNKLSVGVNMVALGTKVQKTVRSELYANSYDVVTFSRPIEVPIKIAITYKDPNGLCPDVTTLQVEIAEAYIAYNNGDLIPVGIGFKTDGFDIGESVPYSRLFTAVNKVLGNYDGAYVDTLTVNGGASNIAIDANQVARFSVENITVSEAS